MRHHHGDPKVSAAIAEKCLELIQALELRRTGMNRFVRRR